MSYEVYETLRHRVRDRFPVMIKLNVDDFVDAGKGRVFGCGIEVVKR